jgi:hypothetical protein
MARRGVASTLAVLFWGALLCMGVKLYSGIAPQGAPCYPNTGQWELYILFPAAMTLLGVCLTIFVNRTPKLLFIIIVLALFALIPPYIVACGGGV